LPRVPFCARTAMIFSDQQRVLLELEYRLVVAAIKLLV
jgi:hypothetical protein